MGTAKEPGRESPFSVGPPLAGSANARPFARAKGDPTSAESAELRRAFRISTWVAGGTETRETPVARPEIREPSAGSGTRSHIAGPRLPLSHSRSGGRTPYLKALTRAARRIRSASISSASGIDDIEPELAFAVWSHKSLDQHREGSLRPLIVETRRDPREQWRLRKASLSRVRK